MTKENYTSLTNEDLVVEIRQLNLSSKNLTLKFMNKHYSELLNQIIQRTNFMQEVKSKNQKITLNARIYCLEHGITTHPTCQCPGCTNVVGWDRSKRAFSRHCSVKCAMLNPVQQEKHKETCKRLYGVENVSQLNDIQKKKEQTCMKNHGVAHPLQSKEILEQMRNDFYERHGVYHPMELQSAKDKLMQTLTEKWGGCGFASDVISDKIRHTLLENLGVDNPSKSSEIQRRKEETCMANYGVRNPFYLVKNNIRSEPEKQVFDFVREIIKDFEIYPNDRTQMTPNDRNGWKYNHELDIWIPKLNLAIEFQGDFWHSALHFPQIWYNDQEKKTQCEEKGITLVQIQEADWNENRKQVELDLKKTVQECMGRNEE